VSVVVDEFEIVPAPERRPDAGPAPASKSPEQPKTPMAQEVEHTLRLRAERKARLEAD
jgi:hypothetical protein